VGLAVALLGALALAAAASGLLPGLAYGLGPLLALLTAGTLAVVWKRRPYPWSRVGFLLAHVAPFLVLLGLWEARHSGLAWLAWTGGLCLLAGCAWMFYLKPPLKRREAARTERPPSPLSLLLEPGARAWRLGLLAASVLLAGLAGVLGHAWGLPSRPGAWRACQTTLGWLGTAAVTVAFLLGLRALWRPPAPGGNLGAASLHWTRAGFLLLGLAVGAGAAASHLAVGAQGAGAAPGRGLLAGWLIYGAVLHTQHLKGFKGRKALLAGVAGWACFLTVLIGLGH
jgi:hypothetical protein